MSIPRLVSSYDPATEPVALHLGHGRTYVARNPRFIEVAHRLQDVVEDRAADLLIAGRCRSIRDALPLAEADVLAERAA